MATLMANNISDLQSAISTLNNGTGGIIEIPAGIEWEINDTNKATTDYAFPEITVDITITAVGSPERAVLRSDSQSEFIFFHAPSGSLVLRNIALKDLPQSFSGDGQGRAIDCNGGLTLDNCSFENNQADDLPLVYVDPGSAAVQILNCVFLNNSIVSKEIVRIDDSGGVFHIENCMFLNNQAEFLISASSHTLLMVNCRFWENDTTDGSDICNWGGTNASVIGCGFFGNTANGDILSLLGISGSFVQVKVCQFISNAAKASQGYGILYILGDEQLVEGSYFEDNRGGLAVKKSDIYNCQFKGNDCQHWTLISHTDVWNCVNPVGPAIVRSCRFEQNTGPLVHTSCTDTDIRFNSWEIPPDESRFVESQGGQVIYDGPINPPAPCPQSGGQSCCVHAVG